MPVASAERGKSLLHPPTGFYQNPVKEVSVIKDNDLAVRTATARDRDCLRMRRATVGMGKEALRRLPNARLNASTLTQTHVSNERPTTTP